MPYKVVLLKCKTKNDFFEPKEDQVVYPLKIASCPKCGQTHTYTRDEVFEPLLREFESDSTV